MAGMASSDTLSITLQTSGENISDLSVYKSDFLVYNLTANYTFVYFNVLVW